MKRLYTIFSILWLSCTCAASTYIKPQGLRQIENGAAYSICQDVEGAVWINTSYGLFRYTGSILQPMGRSLISHSLACDSGYNIYAVDYNGIFHYDIRRPKPARVKCPKLDFYNLSLVTESDGLWAASDSSLYYSDKDSLSLVGRLQGASFSAMAKNARGQIIVADKNTGLYTFSNGELKCVNGRLPHISMLYFDSRGYLWAGFSNHGFALLDENFAVLRKWIPGAGRDVPEQAVRAFCETASGDMLLGGADGLYRVSGNRECRQEGLGFPEQESVWGITRDRDNNIWIGTFYSGVYFWDNAFSGFETLQHTKGLKQISSIAEDSKGGIWYFTDNHGLFHQDNTGILKEIVSGKGIKFQSSLYDKQGNGLWVGVYQGSLLHYDIDKDTWRSIPFCSPEGNNYPESINIIHERKGLLYLGTSHGVFVFDPAREKQISRKLFVHERTIYDICAPDSSTLVMSGFRTFIHDFRTKKTEALNVSGNCSGVEAMPNGDLYVCVTGRGLCRIRAGKSEFLDGTGIADEYLQRIRKVNDDLLIISSRSGISLLSTTEMNCRNYSYDGGLGLSSLRGGCFFKREDGSILAGGNDGALIFHPDIVDNTSKIPSATFGRLMVDNSMRRFENTLPWMESVRLNPGEHNFSLDVFTYNYSGVCPVFMRYMLKGFDNSWTELAAGSPIIYMNIPAGHYRLVLQYSGTANFADAKEIYLDMQLRAKWYRSKTAIITYLLFGAGLIVLILYFFYTRLLLSQKLKNEEEEGRRRTRLYLDISRKLRNPLQQILGYLELFLKQSGNGVPGLKYIEHSYSGAKEMSSIISGFVDLENTAEPVQKIQDDNMPRLHENLMLVLSDNAEMSALLRGLFSEEYDLTVLSDVQEAYEFALKEQPSIIICDIKSDTPAGPELCTRLRQNFETNHIPFVLLTTHASEQRHIESVLLGVDEFIVKPFKTELLAARCHALLQNRRILREKYALVSGTAAGRNNTDRKDMNFLNAAIGAVERNLYAPDLGVGKLCLELNMSKTVLNKRLKEATNLTPREFIEDIRLRHASEMLISGRARIGEIADELGFSSPKYFSIRFRKLYGKSPAEYRAGK